MAKATRFNVDFNTVFESASSQFRGLNPNEPGQWPLLPKVATWAAVVAAVVALGWFGFVSGADEELIAERDKEPGLRKTYTDKLSQAINLDELRKQKLQVQEYVTQLEKQLPGKAEMDALLSDINQAGLGRGLQFELFRPGQVVVKDYYAELPIAIRVSGRFHDIGSFTADVANLSRIVTLHNLVVTTAAKPGAETREGTGQLNMEATARTYRYLDESELAAQKGKGDKGKAAAKPKAGAKK
jgi:type IV pilus assembly protein PilO